MAARRGGSPPNEKAGPHKTGFSPNQTTSAPELTGYRRPDGYAAPDRADRAELEFLAYAEQFGYRIAVRCIDCGSWLADPASVAHHRGPVCRRRAAVS